MFAELDHKSMKKGRIAAPHHHASVTALLYCHLGFLSSQWLLLLSFSQVGYTAPLHV